MTLDLSFYLIGALVVLAVGASKGGFGGGLGMLAVPALSLFVDPRIAAGILLPILCAMDGVSLYKFRGVWDKTNLKILLPGAIVGTLIGALTFTLTNANVIRLLVGLMSLYFVVYLLWGKQLLDLKEKTKPNVLAGITWGSIAGFASYIAHAGGPPVAIYLLPQGLSKSVFASTTILFFGIINFIKLIPYIWLAQINLSTLVPSLILIPFAPLGVLLGIYLHHRVSERLFYMITCVFLTAAGLKLAYEGAMGLWF